MTACLLGLSLSGLPQNAFADVKAGVDDWAAGNYQAALKEWRPLAEAGNPDAQFNLAQAYKMGRGVPVDLDKAEELYGKAAAKGHIQAADIYGLLLFQRGERERAMPYIEASAKRGDPRAWYILGIAHFNGDLEPKDWIRAYALTSLAQQAGLPQATRALAMMDQYLTIDQRQQSVPLAAQIAAAAEATRTQQTASAELGTAGPAALTSTGATTVATAPIPHTKASPPASLDTNSVEVFRLAQSESPASAGADYARPHTVSAAAPASHASPPPIKREQAPARQSIASVETAIPKRDSTAHKPAAVTHAGPWRVQLGAFSVPGNVDSLWRRVSHRPELAGHPKITQKAGRLTKLSAGGFASSGEAESACARLKAAGFTCIATRD